MSLSDSDSAPLRLALFCSHLPDPAHKPSGVSVYVHHMANAFVRDQKARVTVFSVTPKPEGALYEHRLLFPGLAKRYSRNLPFIYFVLPALLNFVDFRGFDVVHTHGDDWFWLRRVRPSVRTMNGSALREAQRATSTLRRISQQILYPLEKLAVRLATLPLALGNDTAAIYHIDQMVDIGIDGTLFYPGAKTAHPSVLFVGTWEGRKRGRLVYETFVKEILPRFPDAHLTMIADQAPPAHPSVTFHKFLNDTAIAQCYREAWVFAYPSTYEGFGLPYCEALASGTPVVCTSSGGAEHILDNGKWGDIVSDDQFGDAILALLADNDLRERRGREALTRGHAFTWHAVSQRYRGYYQRAIDRWNRK